MGMESPNTGPTKESQQDWIAQLKDQMGAKEQILKVVEDRPIEELYNETQKNAEIQDLQRVINNYKLQIEEAEQKLSELES
jgi:hypothetical protein